MFRTFCPAWISLIITQLFLIFLQILVRHFHGSVAVPFSGGSGVWRKGPFCEGDGTQQGITLGLECAQCVPYTGLVKNKTHWVLCKGILKLTMW